MLLNSAALVEGKATLGPGDPWELFFFVSEVVASARKGHFSDTLCSMPHVLRTLGLDCAKAILLHRLGGRRAAEAPRFLVARRANKFCGAALIKRGEDNGVLADVIEYMVVTASERRAGLGAALVEYVKRRAPAGGVVCYCTEASRGMQHLLKRQGFSRTHRAREISVKDGHVAAPSRWLWSPG